MNTQQQYAALRGARDMLRESAKQHRSRGDIMGHAHMCEEHAKNIDLVLASREFVLDPVYLTPKAIADVLAMFTKCLCDLDRWQPEQSTGHSCVCPIHKAAVAMCKR